MKIPTLRERVAKALYDAAPMTATPWAKLTPARQSGWLSDADLALDIALQAAALVADARDPEKPGSYLFKREHIGNNIRGLKHWPEQDKRSGCWLGDPSCSGDCGNYGCGE